MEAASHIDRQAQAAKDTKAQPPPTAASTTQTPLYLHWEYHPHGITRRDIRHIYDTTLAGHSGFDRMIVAFSRPRNLWDMLMPTSMKEPPKRQASNFFPPLPNAGILSATPLS